MPCDYAYRLTDAYFRFADGEYLTLFLLGSLLRQGLLRGGRELEAVAIEIRLPGHRVRRTWLDNRTVRELADLIEELRRRRFQLACDAPELAEELKRRLAPLVDQEAAALVRAAQEAWDAA